MPSVVDISNKRSPQKSPGKPSGSGGPPKTGMMIGLGIATTLAVLFLIWFFLLRGSAGSKDITPYDPGHTRGSGAPAGGGGGKSGPSGTNVPRGLPGGGD